MSARPRAPRDKNSIMRAIASRARPSCISTCNIIFDAFASRHVPRSSLRARPRRLSAAGVPELTPHSLPRARVDRRLHAPRGTRVERDGVHRARRARSRRSTRRRVARAPGVDRVASCDDDGGRVDVPRARLAPYSTRRRARERRWAFRCVRRQRRAIRRRETIDARRRRERVQEGPPVVGERERERERKE